MTKNYKILEKFVKDLSSETPDLETYLYVRDRIGKYQLDIDIASKALKKKHIEINTTFKFKEKAEAKKKSYFEIIFTTIILINNEIKEKKDLEKIILCDVQKEIYPDLEKILLNTLHNSGYSNVKFEKKVDFENLFNQREN
tara:strand:- start:3087 stop:3509 length:423 start_codon:yes stop_codon:yes gene_type:complete